MLPEKFLLRAFLPNMFSDFLMCCVVVSPHGGSRHKLEELSRPGVQCVSWQKESYVRNSDLAVLETNIL